MHFWIVRNTQLLQFVCRCNAITQCNKKLNIHTAFLDCLKYYGWFLCILIGCVDDVWPPLLWHMYRTPVTCFWAPLFLMRCCCCCVSHNLFLEHQPSVRVRSSPGMTTHTQLIMMGMKEKNKSIEMRHVHAAVCLCFKWNLSGK